jgi:hypothetical protein
MTRKLGISLAAILASTAWIGVSHAATVNGITVGDLNIFRDTRAANDVGIGQGDDFQFGANIQGGSAGYDIRGIFTPLGGSAQNLGSLTPCGPLSVNANFCAKSATFTAARLNGSWQVQLANGTTTAKFNLPSVGNIPGQAVAFPKNVTIMANTPSATNPNGDPTISWTLPNGTSPNAFRVNIYDKSVILANGTADTISSTNISPTATSFTPTIALKPGGSYAIGFQVILTRDGQDLPLNSGNRDILSRSNSFFDFSPPKPGSPPSIALPSIDPAGVYHFNIGSVGPSQVTFIDPKIAIGYNYAIGTGDPNFASVTLPNVGGGHFILAFLMGGQMVTDPLNAGVQFFFQNGGVSAFEVTGIDPSAKLDPGNAGAFVTGLTFVSSGTFTGTMTPITTNVNATPLPATWAMMMTGLIGFGVLAFRGRRSSSVAFGTA